MSAALYIIFENRTNRVASSDITIKGVYIPKGMMIIIPVIALHMDPEIWPDPTKFNPVRYVIQVFCLIYELYAYIGRKCRQL